MSDATTSRPASAMLAAPGRYVHGVGAVNDLPVWLQRLHLRRPLPLVDPVRRAVAEMSHHGHSGVLPAGGVDTCGWTRSRPPA